MKLFGHSKTLFQASITVFIITIVSKVVAYFENAILAAYFGTSSEIDMFYLANSIVMRFIFTVFGGLSIVTIIMYNDAVKETRFNMSRTVAEVDIRNDASINENKERMFVSSLLTFTMLIAILVSIFIYMFAPLIAKIMTNNYTVYERDILCRYMRLLSTVTIFYVICIIFTAILNANKLFIPGTFCVIIQNLILINFIIFLSPQIRIWAVVIGFLVGYIFQGLFLFLCVRKIITITIASIKSLNIKRLLLLLLPLVLGEASGEINLLLDQLVSTRLGIGYISALSYSGILDEFVSSFFVKILAYVLLPFFSNMCAEKKYSEISSKMRRVINAIVLLLLPITIVTVLTSQSIVSIVYERGHFNERSVVMTSSALMGYGLGFIAKAVFIIVRRPFYVIEDTKVPMLLSLFSVLVNIVLTVFLSRFLGVFGVTFATTVAFCMGDILAFMIMNKRIIKIDWNGELSFIWKLLIAGIAATISVYFVNDQTQSWSSIMQFLTSTIVCFAVYSSCLWLLHVEEFERMISLVRKKKIKNGL